ncbi:MAG: hypothetical protein ACREON_17280 [Gemmatimonadaceae bacterium]
MKVKAGAVIPPIASAGASSPAIRRAWTPPALTRHESLTVLTQQRFGPPGPERPVVFGDPISGGPGGF